MTAFRYIAAEMSAGEAAAFEQRLAEDHSAREAVAEMVQLTELASAALAPCPTVVPAGQRHWVAPLAWMIAGAAACLALVATLSGVGTTPDETKRVQTEVASSQDGIPGKIDHVALVRRTAELRDDRMGVWPSEAARSADEALLAVAADVQQLDAELTVPDWLLAAVSVSSSAECVEIQEN